MVAKFRISNGLCEAVGRCAGGNVVMARIDAVAASRTMVSRDKLRGVTWRAAGQRRREDLAADAAGRWPL